MDFHDTDTTLRILCRMVPVAKSDVSQLWWLIGSPFFPSATIISVFKCIHTLSSNHSSPDVDFSKEADDLRLLLPKGFKVIGALIAKSDSDPKTTATEAINAAVRLRKLLHYDTNEGLSADEELVVAAANSNSGGDNNYFVPRNGSPETLSSVGSIIYEDQPEKFIWQRGCILHCRLPIRLPVYYPAKNLKVEYFSEMESSTKILDPRKTDPKKIQELVGIAQKRNLPASSAPVGKKTPARVSTPASTSSLLRDQPDDAIIEEQPGEGEESRKRLKTTDSRHGKGKEGRFIAPPKPSTIEIPAATSTDLEHMAPEELNAYLSKLIRAVRITGEVATSRIKSPSSDLAEKEELLKKQKSQIDSLEAKVRKLDGRRLSLEADLEASQLNLEKAKKVAADREAELVKVKANLEEVRAELARCVKARDDLQLEVDSFASRMETLKKEIMGSEELRTDIMLLMTQAMKGGFTNALRDVKKVLPDFDISSIERANLYDEECFSRYGRYIDDFRAGISLHDKYVKPVLEQQRIAEADAAEDVEMDDPDTASSRPPNA